MLKTVKLKSKILEEGLSRVKTHIDVLILEINPKSNSKKLTQSLNEFFNTYPKGQVILISKIKYLKAVGGFDYGQEFELLEKIGKTYFKKGLKVNTIRIGAILEERDNYLNETISEIKGGKKIYYTEGDQFRYLISAIDVVQAVQKIIKSQVFGEVFNITLNKVRERDLIARLLEHYNFNIEPLEDFKDKFREKLIDLENNKLINFKPEKTISAYIKTTLNKDFTPKRKQIKNKKRFKIKLPTYQLKSGAKNLVNLLKTIIMVLFFIGFLSVLDIGLDNYYLYESMKKGDYEKSLLYANKLREISLPTKFGSNYQKTYNALYYALNAFNIAKNDLTKNGKMGKDTIASVMGISTQAINYAESIDSVYFLTPKEKDLFNSKKKLIDGLQEKTKYLKLLTLYPENKKEQTTIVLIQNSNELRPSGGFIGSYAVIKTKNLDIVDYKFDDIYNIDGTLEEKYKNVLLEMPSEYLDFIKTDYLYSRDANLILDSSQRDEIVTSYFEKALGIKIDYLVYLNLKSLKSLLEVTGPIKISTYDEEVTAENFDTLAQTYSEKNYYEGSTQKKNFLTLLGNKVVEKLSKENTMSLNLLLKLLEIFESKNVVIHSQNLEYQKVIEELALDGNVINREKYKDFLYIIENNLGENKVNKKTEKKVELKINYDQRRGVKSNDLFITLSNFSNNYNWPYGDYQGYLHVGIPESNFVTQVKIKQIDTSKEVDITRNIIVKKINNTNVAYIPFLVRPLEEIFITLSYETKDPIFLDSEYKLKVQKQPGAEDYYLKVSLNVPDHQYKEKDYIINKDVNVTLD